MLQQQFPGREDYPRGCTQTFRFRLIPDEQGYFYCQLCWDQLSQAHWQANKYAQYALHTSPQPVPSGTEALKRPPTPPWRQQVPAKKIREDPELSSEQINELLVGVEAAAV